MGKFSSAPFRKNLPRTAFGKSYSHFMSCQPVARYGPGEVCEQWQALVVLVDSAQHVVIDRFPVSDRKNQHVIFLQLVHDSVISNAKFPIAFEGLSKRYSVLVGLKSETRCNSLGNPTAKVTWDVRNIFLTDSGVVVEGERHLSLRTFRGGPHLCMSLCGLSIKCGHPLLGDIS